MTQQLAPTKGSLQEKQSQSKLTLAEAFLSIEALVITDVSASMNTSDVKTEGGVRSRHAEAQIQLANLQARFPGKLAVVAFSDRAEFCPSGVLPPTQGGTNLLGALQFVQAADGAGIKFICVSDGEPDSADGVLSYAKTLQTPIDSVFIGTSQRGREFMEKLSKATSGRAIVRGVQLLEEGITLLLGDGK